MYSVDLIGDTAAGLQGMMIEVAFIISFFLGPLLCESIGFRETADLQVGLFLVEIGLLIFCGGIVRKKKEKPR